METTNELPKHILIRLSICDYSINYFTLFQFICFLVGTKTVSSCYVILIIIIKLIILTIPNIIINIYKLICSEYQSLRLWIFIVPF